MPPIIYIGIHRVNKMHMFAHSMISVNLMLNRVKPFTANHWILDSGAFTRVTSGKGHLPVKEYADIIRRWDNVGNFQAAVSQDYMCEPVAFWATGLTIKEHQRLTTKRYLDLVEELGSDKLVMPVLQGYLPSDYVRHLRELSPILDEGKWVGIGSVCKRQGKPHELLDIMQQLKEVRPDLRFHGFGVKRTSLLYPDIQDMFYSVDSMSWSYNARVNGRNANDPDEAIQWHDSLVHDMMYKSHEASSLEEMPMELAL